MRLQLSLIGTIAVVGLWSAAPTSTDSVFFSTGSPDGKLGALSQPASPSKLETETADEIILTEATVFNRATIRGLIPTGTPVSSITQVEIELYHVFPTDSDLTRTPGVPTRTNSPSDVEIDSATRDSSKGTLRAIATVQSASFSVTNTVVNGIHPSPGQFTGGEGALTGEEVEIDITFTPPIFLLADHYFFRPQVQVTGGDFLYVSAPRPILTPGTPFLGDLQAWIRNSNLSPDWLRIGTDITHQGPFNMTFSLTGNGIPEAGTPGLANCHGETVSAMANEFGGMNEAASILGYSSVKALQNAIRGFCQQ